MDISRLKTARMPRAVDKYEHSRLRVAKRGSNGLISQDGRPVMIFRALIGHPFGGVIVQKLLGRDLGAAASRSTRRRSKACFASHSRRCT